MEVFLDAHNNVRTCMVEFRPCHFKDAGKSYVSRAPETMTIRVQRFSVLLLTWGGGVPQGHGRGSVQGSPEDVMQT